MGAEGPLASLQDVGCALNAEDLLDGFPEGLLVVAEDGQVVRVSYALLDLLSCTPEQIIGRPLREVLGPESDGAPGLERLLERPTYQLELTLRSADGSGVPVTFTSRPLRDARGNPIALCTVHDIRDRRVMEARAEALAADREQVGSRLAALICHLPVGVLAEDDTGRITEANRALCQIFALGMEPAQLVGQQRDLAVSGLCVRVRDPDQFLQRMIAIAAARQPVLGESVALLDGRVLERDYVPVSAGTHKGHLWIYRDVTERERTKRQLMEASRRAEAANEAKGRFLAMMSHEMRTPLGVIVGLSDLLSGTCTEEERTDYLRRLQWNANALLEQIQDVLDFSRLESGQLDLCETPFDPIELVEDVGAGLALRAHAKGLELVVDADEDAPRQLVGDEARIRQVLVNLVGNAIKFTDRGEVCLRVGRAVKGVRFEVEDTGRGIPRDQLPRVFERFVRVETPGQPRAAGTGLGLSICKILSEAMGGTLTARSVVGEGSCFSMELPLEAASAPAGQSWPPDALAGLVVGVLDPNARARGAVGRALTHAGAEVHECEDLGALRALLVRDTPLDVIVYADHEQGAVGAALRALLSQRGRRAPLVSMTRMDGRAQGARATFSVTKPVRRGSLMETVLAAAARPTPAPRVLHSSLPPPESMGLRVLLAEDDPDNRAMFARVLTRAGFKVDAAEDGQAALARAADAAYDLIVTDLQMPGVNGFELAQALREREASQPGAGRTPIVALTAHALAGTRERCLAAGMDDYLTKPVRARQLVLAAQRWADARPVVIVADDDPDTRMLLGKYLEERPEWRAAVVHGGAQALALARRGRVSAMVLDMSMPDMDGYEVARAVRATPALAQLPIIALTGHSGEDERARCLRAGCSAYLTKPVRKVELLQAVERALLTPVVEGDADQGAAPPAGEPTPVQVDPDIADLVPGYLEHRRAEIPTLRALLDARDFDGLMKIGHKLKGSGSAYGFDPISAAGKLLEDAARRRELQPASEAVDRLTVYLERVTWVARE